MVGAACFDVSEVTAHGWCCTSVGSCGCPAVLCLVGTAGQQLRRDCDTCSAAVIVLRAGHIDWSVHVPMVKVHLVHIYPMVLVFGVFTSSALVL